MFTEKALLTFTLLFAFWISWDPTNTDFLLYHVMHIWCMLLVCQLLCHQCGYWHTSVSCLPVEFHHHATINYVFYQHNVEMFTGNMSANGSVSLLHFSIYAGCICKICTVNIFHLFFTTCLLLVAKACFTRVWLGNTKHLGKSNNCGFYIDVWE